MKKVIFLSILLTMVGHTLGMDEEHAQIQKVHAHYDKIKTAYVQSDTKRLQQVFDELKKMPMTQQDIYILSFLLITKKRGDYGMGLFLDNRCLYCLNIETPYKYVSQCSCNKKVCAQCSIALKSCPQCGENFN